MSTRDIDYTTGTLTARLTGERAKIRNGKLTITDDLTWQTRTTKLNSAVVHGEVRIRDRRWLWLRRKTITVPPTHVAL